VERLEVRNLVSPLDGVLNTRADVTNLDRLRNRTLAPPSKPDPLEDIPVFGEGTIRRANLAVEQFVAPTLGARVHYSYTESANDAALFDGKRIPYLPRHWLDIGATWTPGWRTSITAQAVYRSERFRDEANLVAMPAGWDARVNVFVESAAKRWAVEVFAVNLLKKEVAHTLGMVVSYRF
jgi:hypothetical protein